MNYAEPLSNQVLVFIRSVGFGVLLGLIYELFSAVRILLGDKKRAYILCDISFSLTATVLSFFYMVLYNSGRVRLNLLAAQLIGAIAFHIAAGRYLVKPFNYLMEKTRQLLLFLFYPIRYVFGKVKNILARRPKKEKKKLKNIKNIIKIPLKK